MSNWMHTLTVIVPESLIAKANQLALAIGTSEDDVNTFRKADWTALATMPFALLALWIKSLIMSGWLIHLEMQCWLKLLLRCRLSPLQQMKKEHNQSPEMT